MNDIKGETGARYNFTRTMMRKFIEEKTFNLGTYTPIDYVKVNNRTQIGYTIGIATDNPEGVEKCIRETVLNNSSPTDYELEVFPTRLHRNDLREKYPVTVCIKLTEFTNFEYSTITRTVPGNHYMSNMYNNGMLPCAIIQYEIPPKYRAARNREMARQKEINGGHIDNVTMSEYDSVLLRKIWVTDKIDELTIYLGQPSKDGPKIDYSTISYTISPKSTLFRERPLMPKADVEVVDCLPVRNSIPYQSRCGFRNNLDYMTASQNEKDRQMGWWLDFLGNRTMTRIGSPLNSVRKTPDLLMTLFKVTIPNELPAGLKVKYFNELENLNNDLYNRIQGDSDDSAITT